MQSFLGLMSTSLLSLWPVIASSIAANFFDFQVFMTTAHFPFLKLPSQVSNSDTTLVSPVLPPPPISVCLRAMAVMLSAGAPRPWYPPSHLLCTCFHSIDFIVSSFIAVLLLFFPHFMTLHHSGKWKLSISHFISKTQGCIRRGDKINMNYLGIFPRLLLLNRNCS